jgi:hypothetical protein
MEVFIRVPGDKIRDVFEGAKHADLAASDLATAGGESLFTPSL